MSEEKLYYVIKTEKERPVQINRPKTLPFNALFADIVIDDSLEDKIKAAARGFTRAARELLSPRPSDPVYERFTQLKRLAGEVYRKDSDRSRDYLFYKQATFMADFTDSFTKYTPFNTYYPNYQMMNYEQFRTYFSWRTKVRLGNVGQTDLSYVFLYIYELLNNIGVMDGEDGLVKLFSIWKAYRKYTTKLDRYMAGWIRDYIIINPCDISFNDLAKVEPLLGQYYPDNTNENSFDYYCGLSSYKIKQSIIYTPENEAMLTGCFNHIFKRLEGLLLKEGLSLNDLINEKGAEQPWFPLHNAIFYMRPDFFPKSEKVIRLNNGYEYCFKNGSWTSKYSGGIGTDGRQLIGYILKRMEQLLRKAAKFKYKLSADDKSINKEALDRLLPHMGSTGLLSEIDLAIKDFVIDSRKTVVTINEESLNKIRQNALITQEKLIVNLEESQKEEVPPSNYPVREAEITAQLPSAAVGEQDTGLSPCEEPENVWEVLLSLLEPLERSTLKQILDGASLRQIQDFLRGNGVMLEVLLDGINQKAFDTIGDTLLEFTDEITLYDDYIEQLRVAAAHE
jgi:hypothetical protein